METIDRRKDMLMFRRIVTERLKKIPRSEYPRVVRRILAETRAAIAKVKRQKKKGLHDV